MDQETVHQFFQSLAHDIKNPLTSIKGFSSLLLQELKDAPKQQKMAEYIYRAVSNIETHLENGANELMTLNQNSEHHTLTDRELEQAILGLFQQAKSSPDQSSSSIIFETTEKPSDKIVIQMPRLKETDHEH